MWKVRYIYEQQIVKLYGHITKQVLSFLEEANLSKIVKSQSVSAESSKLKHISKEYLEFHNSFK